MTSPSQHPTITSTTLLGEKLLEAIDVADHAGRRRAAKAFRAAVEALPRPEVRSFLQATSRGTAAVRPMTSDRLWGLADDLHAASPQRGRTKRILEQAAAEAQLLAIERERAVAQAYAAARAKISPYGAATVLPDVSVSVSLDRGAPSGSPVLGI